MIDFIKKNIVAFILAAALIFVYVNKQSEINQLTYNNKALIDTIHITKDKYGEQTAKTLSLEVTNINDLLAIKSKDSTVLKLQHYADSLKKAGNKTVSASIIGDKTNDHGSSATTITRVDSIKKDSIVFLYPTYYSKWTERWSTGEVTANKDSIKRDIKISNEYEYSTNYNRKTILSPWIPTVSIKNLNPNTTTTELKSVIVKPKPQVFSLGGNAGYGFMPSQMKFGWTISFGLNINLIPH